MIRKYRQFQDDGTIKRNFLRHYYDIYMLLDCEDVRRFIGTEEYIEHKNDRIRGKDRDFRIHDAFDIRRPELEREYERTVGLYYRGQPSLTDIVERIEPFLDQL